MKEKNDSQERYLWDQIVPRPTSVSGRDGLVSLPATVTVALVAEEATAKPDSRSHTSMGRDQSPGGEGMPVQLAEAFCAILSEAVSRPCRVAEAGEVPFIELRLSGEAAGLSPDPRRDPVDTSDESWHATVEEAAAENAPLRISGSGYRGLMRAAASFAQAISRAEAGESLLPTAELGWEAKYGWRGAMLDCSRHFFPVEFVCRFVDLLALHSLSVFHWHLTDDQGWRFPSTAFPLLTERGAWRDDNTTHRGTYGGSYSQDEIHRVVSHAARRGITVVPEIDIPGHVRSLLHAMPQLSCSGEAMPVPLRYGIFDEVLCAGNPETHAVLETLFRELCELFPSPYIHVGGDECPSIRWEGCEKCRERARELGIDTPALLHGDLVSSAVRSIAAAGRRAVGWDEVLEGGAPDDVVVMAWRSKTGAADAKNDRVICPTERACYFDHKHRDDPDEPGRLGVCSVRDTYHFTPGDSLGSQGNIWTESIRYGREIEYMAFPRLAALSEVLAGSAHRAAWGVESDRLRRHAVFLRSIGVGAYDGPTE